MPSMIDPTHPAAGIAVSKAASRANWVAAKAELEHGGFFLAHSGAVERRTQDKLREPGASVIDFGADPTGAADSTSAIQQAIDAVGAAGGGVVYLPPGTYKIIPPIDPATMPGVDRPALSIAHDNVTIQGAGMRATLLRFRGFGDVDPLTVADGQRGHGIMIRSEGTNEANARRGVVLRDFQLDGGCDNAGNWDSWHKAVLIDVDKTHRDHAFQNIWLKGWRGENLHHQGNGAFDILVDGCKISNGRANAFNLNGGRIDVRRCEVWDVPAISEDLSAGFIRYIGNRFRDTTNTGMALFRHRQAVPSDDDFTSFVVEGNIFERCGYGVWVGAAHSVVVGNVFIDCTDAIRVQVTQTGAFPGSPSPDNPDVSGVVIADNIIKAERITFGTAISIFSFDDTRPMKDVMVRDNVIACRDPTAVRFEIGIDYRLTPDCANIFVEDNVITGCRVGIRAHNSSWPSGVNKVPVFRRNDVRDGIAGFQVDDEVPAFWSTQTQGSPTITAGVTQPILPTIAAFQPDAPFAEPSIVASRYMKGTRLKLTCVETNAPAYIPRTSAHFRVPRDRFLYPDCVLEVEFDGTRLVEVGWQDKRAEAETTVASGTTLDAQGRDVVKLALASPTTLTAHQAVPEGAPITVYATNGNATLANNAAIATTSGANLTLVANQPYRFILLGSVLRQMA